MNDVFDRVLSSAERKNLPSSAFALPERRALPIPDVAHARAALSRASMMLAAHTIDRATYNTALRYIYAKYPQLEPQVGRQHDSVSVWYADAAVKSSFGWKVGDLCAYVYRSAPHPEGRVTAVHPGTTRETATVTISPAPGFRYGEGSITRKISDITHISAYSKRASTPIARIRAKGNA